KATLQAVMILSNMLKRMPSVTGCSFELYEKKIDDSQWCLTVKNANYNHKASENISGHPFSHQLNEED
ncbi:9684_t:CDS:2, partial [Cetraspora pellucida]